MGKWTVFGVALFASGVASLGCSRTGPFVPGNVPIPADNNSYSCGCVCRIPPGAFTAGTCALAASLDLGTGECVTNRQSREICFPNELNPANTVGVPARAATDADLDADCDGRVETLIEEGMRRVYSSCGLTCDCSADHEFVAGTDVGVITSLETPKCNNACAGAAFGPGTGFGGFNIEEATFVAAPNLAECALGADTVHVCGPPLRDPPESPPGGVLDLFVGHNSHGEVVTGSADVTIGGRVATTPVRGRVTLVDGYCPGSDCRVGLEFSFDADPFVVGDGITNDHFEAITVAGSSLPGGAAMDSFGQATFLFDEVFLTARATGVRRILGVEWGRETQAMYFPNLTAVELSVDWSAETFRIRGDFAVPEENPDTAPAVALTLDVRGSLSNVPPVAMATTSATVECSSVAGAEVTLDATASSDANDNLLAYVWRRGTSLADEVISREVVATVVQPVGTATYHLTTLDTFHQGSTATVEATVADTTAPALADVALSESCLWPPNHAYVRFALGDEFTANASDACGPTTVRVLDVVSDQPDDAIGTGDGATTDDVVFGPGGFCVRSERAGSDRAGRTYTARLVATDAEGNSTFEDVTLHVPHSQSTHCDHLDSSRFLTDAEAVSACDFGAPLDVSMIATAAEPLTDEALGPDAGGRDAGVEPGPGLPAGCSAGPSTGAPWSVFAFALVGFAVARRLR